MRSSASSSPALAQGNRNRTTKRRGRSLRRIPAVPLSRPAVKSAHGLRQQPAREQALAVIGASRVCRSSAAAPPRSGCIQRLSRPPHPSARGDEHRDDCGRQPRQPPLPHPPSLPPPPPPKPSSVERKRTSLCIRVLRAASAPIPRGTSDVLIPHPHNLLGVTFNTLVRSSQGPSGPAGGASVGYSLGRGAAGPDRRCTNTAAGALRVIV